MRARKIIDEYELEIDDIRWYLAHHEAERILSYRDDIIGLTKLIQSGKLEAEWYRMEERFVEALDEKLNTHVIDEPEIRKLCNEIEIARTKRWTI